MWFTICYVNIVLFVCFVTTEIQDDHYKLADDAVARLVSSRGNYTAQVRVRNMWYPLCDDRHYKTIERDFCDMVKKSVNQKQDIFGEPEVDVSADVGEYAKLSCDEYSRRCVPKKTHSCTKGGVAKSCDDDYKPGPDSSKPSISTCSFPAVTTTNCTPTATLWMTYEHVFYHKDLPEEFIAWTSSYFNRSTSLDDCSQLLVSTSYVTTNETTVSSHVDCLQYCLNESAWRNTTLSAVEIHGNMCNCFADTGSTGPTVCKGDIYRVTTSKRQTSPFDNNSHMEYCIAVQHSNYANKFTIRECNTTKLPQLCGTHDCWPNDGCTNGATCIIAKNYLNIKCECADSFTGPKCEDKMTDIDNETDPQYMPSTTPGYYHEDVDADADDNPVPVEFIWASCFGSIAVIIALLILFVYCIYKCKSKKPPGEIQRPNSVLNRTYGTSHTNMTTYDRVDDDEEYDLLDEVAMTSGHPKDSVNKGVLVLDDYSSPSDVILGKQDGNMTDYTTTYDDPIRKQSEHGSAIKLNSGLSGETVINPNEDIELKLLGTASALPGRVEKEGSENESRKSQFKGCLCSMNVSAESDIENPEQLPKPNQDNGIDSGDMRCIGTHIDQEIDATTVEETRCSGGSECSKHYFKLAPRANSDKTKDGLSEKGSMKAHIATSNAVIESIPCKSAPEADGTFLRSVLLCQDDKTDKGQAGDDSDYEDTSVVDAKDNSDYENTSVDNEKGAKTRHVTMPMHGDDFCLNSPPEDLMERLGIRIVPDTCTYETYMALPKSRADLMNPYYTNYNQHKFTNMASSSRETDGAAGNNDECEYNVTISSRTKGSNSDRKGSTDNEYDKLYNARRNLQVQNSNNNNAYDHILSLLGKKDGRKRLNSY